MSIHPETLTHAADNRLPHRDPTAGDELDRTDELPRLDIEAYEASLQSTAQGLARTDIWSVTALHDISELTEAAAQAPTDKDGAAPEANALTVNVDSILKRIADLEAEVVVAHEANDALQKRNEATLAERDHLAAQVQSLEAEIARQREHRDLAQEMAERLERKLRDEIRATQQKLGELVDTHAKERAAAQTERADLKARLSDAAQERAALEEARHKLQDELEVVRALAQQRAETIGRLEYLLGEEKRMAAKVAGQLAAKLADYDKLDMLLLSRNEIIEELNASRDRLNEQLQSANAAHAETAAELAELQRAYQKQVAVSAERDRLIAERRAELDQAHAQLDKLRSDVAAAEQRIAQRESELAHRNAASATLEKQLLQLMQELDDVRQSNASLASELQEARSQIERLADERDALVAGRTELHEKLVAVENANAELVRARERIEIEHVELQGLVRKLEAEREASRPIQEELRERTAELEQQKAETAQLRDELAAAKAAADESARLAQAHAAELEASRAKISEQTRAVRNLEQAIAKRDELSDELRAQLQSVENERAALLDQLEKARGRVKALSEEVFRRDHRIAELRTELTVHTEALAAIRRDINRVGREVPPEEDDGIERVLEPVDHPGEPIVLSGKMLTVGRTTESDVCIPSKLVSRQHARLLVGPTGVIIEDAGSTNGCYVNGKQVRKHLMHDGDVLELGDLRYRLTMRNVRDTKVRDNVIPIFDPKPNA